ncbi:MAG TPA: hypothetical protein VN626_00205 [Clostridia bacterium]|nr:hypothetical protein [Clostridia bacterium]
MANRYKIWDRTSPVMTPAKKVFTSEEWLNQYTFFIERPEAVMVLANRDYDGAMCESLQFLKERCEEMGAQFAENLSNQELLDAIEQFENDLAAAQQATAEEAAAKEAEYAAASLKAEQDVAGAFAYQNMMNY